MASGMTLLQNKEGSKQSGVLTSRRLAASSYPSRPCAYSAPIAAEQTWWHRSLSGIQAAGRRPDAAQAWPGLPPLATCSGRG